jgi:ribosome-associated protein
MSHTIIDALEAKKGEDILLMDIRDLAPFADFFIICSGTSDRMLQALADASIEAVHKTYHINVRQEGQPQEGWLLVDFGDIVLHLFSPDRRNYYRLEELWSKGKILLHLQ